MSCCVPQCINTTRKKPPGTQFYRFPADEKKCKKWLKLIRRENYEWTMSSYICSWHFPNGKDAGPSRFAWNEDKSFDLLGINKEPGPSKPAKPKKDFKPEIRGPLPPSPSKVKEKELLDLRSLVATLKSQIQTDKESAQRQIQTLKVELEVAEKQNEALERKLNLYKKFEDDAQKLRIELNKLNNKFQKLDVRERPTPTTLIKFKDVMKMNENTRASITSFRDASSIQFLWTMLKLKGVIYKKSKRMVCLPLEDQIILFLMKIRLDLPHLVLGKLFGISSYSVSNCCSTLLNGVYELFYEGEGPLKHIPSRLKTASSLPKCFSDMPNCRIVLDCTEFAMEAPRKLSDKQVTYSSYKSKHTMKALIGCAPNGTPVFVSDLYGGSESDKAIVIESKILQQMDPGDLILADKGFELFDILPPGVALNIPSFLTQEQFSFSEIIQNRAYARARVIVERLNARIKVYKILDCIQANDRRKASRLVKVCTALTTLMPSLMNELNEIEIN